jgi:hypothetical protein
MPLQNIPLLGEMLSSDAQSLIDSTGLEFVQQIGLDAVRDVVFDVLTGKNLRSSTEMITRRRLAILNGALLALFLEGERKWPGFVERLPELAAEQLRRGELSKTEQWLNQWILGLTNKAVQNVLRDEGAAVAQYRAEYVEACLDAIGSLTKTHGNLDGTIALGNDLRVQLTWQLMVYLMAAIGAQTLTIRGSEKSTYGKLFERLVLGSLLVILGFKHVLPHNADEVEHVFWLSDRSGTRESDATLLYERGKGIRFDIGFIGRGNPEITLDKVSRFQRRIELGSAHWYMSTVIIVDSIGRGSKLRQRTDELDATVIQMSGSYWPQQVARHLHEILRFEHPLVDMPGSQIADFLRAELDKIAVDEFVPGL